MSQMKPAAAPSCWGSKFQDGDDECRQCQYRDTCRPAVLNRMAAPIPTTYRPSLPTYTTVPLTPPPPPSPMFNPSTAVVPLPPRPYVAPPAASIPLPPKMTTSSTPAPQPVQVHQPATYFSSSGYSLPNTTNPNPLASMHRPGAPAPAYFFNQYPGEKASTRIVKNLLLRAAEAIFQELVMFFRHWTWPPRA